MSLLQKKDISKTSFIILAIGIIVLAAFFTGISAKLLMNADVSVSEPTGEAEKSDFSFVETESGYAVSSYSGNSVYIVIPDSYMGKAVVAISDGAFKENNIIFGVSLPESITSIGLEAFYMCQSLQRINLPDALTSIGNYAFFGCIALDDAPLSSGLITVGDYAFSGCAKLTAVKLGSRVAKIGEQAFADCTGLTELTLPESVLHLGNRAFYSCTHLASVSGGAGLSTVGAQVFEKTAWLRTGSVNGTALLGSVLLKVEAEGEYTAPEGVTRVADYAFYAQDKLTSVVFPQTLTHLGTYAFGECKALKSVTLPNSLQSMGDGVFSNCAAIESVVLPASFTTIGANCFFGCSSLSEISVEEGNTAFYSDDSALYSDNGLTLYRYFPANHQTSFTVPDGVIRLETDSFSGSNMLETIVMGNAIALGERVFYSCKNLKNVVFSHDITAIPTEVFAYCTSLSSIELAEGIVSVSSRAFFACTSLVVIQFPASVESVSSDAFCECVNLGKITVDEENAYFTVYEGVLFNKDMSVLMLYPAAKDDSKYEVPETVTEISDNAFLYCAKLEYIYINASLKKIGSSAFYGCSRLRAVRNNSGNSSFPCDEGVLFNADKTELILFPPSKAVTAYTVPVSVTQIADGAFFNVQMLTKLTVSENVTEIGAGVFDYCDSLTVVCPQDSAIQSYCEKNSIKVIH